MDGEAKEKVCITAKKRMEIIRKNKKESQNKTFDKVENYNKDLYGFFPDYICNFRHNWEFLETLLVFNQS